MADRSDASGSLTQRLFNRTVLGTVLAVVLVLVAAVYFLVDDVLAWGLEYYAGQSMGARVDVGDLRTGWLQPSLTIRDLQVTDPDTPARNVLHLGVISARVAFSPLLRGRVVIEEARLDGVRFNTYRESPGWVRDEGGALRGMYSMTGRLLSSRFPAGSGTGLDDTLSLVAGTPVEKRWNALRDRLETPGALRDARSTLETREKVLETTLDQLPDREDIESVKQTIEDVRESRSGDVLGAVQGIADLQRLVRRLETFSEQIKTVAADLRATGDELTRTKQRLEEAVEHDRETLSDLTLPEVSVGSLSRQLFGALLEQHGGALHDVVRKVQPSLSGESTGRSDGSSEPATGDSPDVWLKQLTISGEGGGTVLEGDLRNLSTRPLPADHPLDFTFSARPSDAAFSEVRASLSRSMLKGDPRLNYNLEIRDWTLRPWTLLQRNNTRFSVKGGSARFGLEGSYEAGRLTTRLGLMIDQPTFQVEAADDRLESILRRVTSQLIVLRLRATGRGRPGSLQWSVESNLGRALADGLRTWARQQAERVRAEVERRFQRQIGAPKQHLVDEIESLMTRARGTLKQRRDLVNRLKNSLSDLRE